MLAKIRSLFTPNLQQKEEDMAVTATRQPTPTTTGKSCSVQGSKEQLSATSDCSGNTVCENAVRERAYLLWEKAGYPQGDGVSFWLRAEQELQSETPAALMAD
jgi:hypothetical protein